MKPHKIVIVDLQPLHKVHDFRRMNKRKMFNKKFQYDIFYCTKCGIKGRRSQGHSYMILLRFYSLSRIKYCKTMKRTNSNIKFGRRR